ncbi:MAG: hypothetical protein K2J70_08190 [Muribaculaceae bacterium]|nr:hypothetical protein [Muribaculaceae bacterium]
MRRELRSHQLLKWIPLLYPGFRQCYCRRLYESAIEIVSDVWRGSRFATVW